MTSQKSVLSPRADKSRLQKFMVATPVAAAATMGGASTASAAIVYFDIVDQQVTTNQTVSFGSINLGAGTYDFTSTGPTFSIGFSGDAEKPRLSAGTNMQASRDSTVIGLGLTLFSEGASISSASSNWNSGAAYIDSNFSPSTTWPNVSAGYAGLRLGAGPSFSYGWAELVYNDAANTLTITAFAFESELDTAIEAGAGAIPEPAASALLLAAGAGGIAAYRRRKRDASAVLAA